MTEGKAKTEVVEKTEAEKKAEVEKVEAKIVAGKDLDALIAEAGLIEPPKVHIHWKGQDWALAPLGALDPRLLVEATKDLEGMVLAIEAGLGSRQRKLFQMPRQVMLGNGFTEIQYFLDVWAEASNEVIGLGE